MRVAPDDTVTVVIGKSEMGQGIYTGLAMALAEELDVDPDAREGGVRAGAIPAFNVPFAPVQFTGGSMSTSTTYMQLREAGARARAMLVAAAARHWKVDADDAAHRRRQGLQRLEVARATARWRTPPRSCRVPEKVALKDPAQFRYLGKPQKRLDAPMKVDGSAKFGIDMRVPGMLFAVVARPPVIGATLGKSRRHAPRAPCRASSTSKQIPAGVAVYGTNTWAAKRGREALKIEWNEGPNSNLSTASLRARVPAAARHSPARWPRERGNVKAALARRGEAHRRGIRAAVSRAFAHGAAQLPRRRARRWLRPVPGHADAVAGSRCRRRRAGRGCRRR